MPSRARFSRSRRRLQHRIGEAREERPLENSAASHLVECDPLEPHVVARARALDLQIPWNPGAEPIERLLQRRCPGQALTELGQRQLAYGDTADLVVVIERDRTVAQEVQIGLDHVGALIDGEGERFERVLELVHRGAAMRDVQHQLDPPIGLPRVRSTARSQPP